MDNEPKELDEQIAELMTRMDELRAKCLAIGDARGAPQTKRLAKTQQRLIPYLLANFCLMNEAQATFEADLGVETAIETIAFLESEEKARQFQPDFPEDDYYGTVQWMSACAYDNLARHVANRDGCNSDGVHDAINDGMEVCRRTGKMECIACFREYASDVFRAAGDLEMAIHHARTVANSLPIDDQSDRRWSGADELARLLLLNGQIEDARQAALQALRLVETYHNPLSARLRTGIVLEEILLLAGNHDELPALREETGANVDLASIPPEGEDPQYDYRRASCDAVAACCRGEHARAVELLSPWDARFRKTNILDEWLEVRLRIIAAHQLAGDVEKVQRLASQLEARAEPARDWLTLARLKGILEGTVHPSPMALAGSATSGPFAPPRSAREAEATGTAPVEAANVTEATAQTAAEEPPATPLGPFFDRLIGRWQASDGEAEVFAETLDEMLAIQPADVVEAENAARLIYLAAHAARITERTAETWRWAEPFARLFPQHGTTLNVLADLGAAARGMAGEQADDVVAAERIDALFRTSLDLDHEHPRNFARAGYFYLECGRKGDAERCLARGFRLDRTDALIALNLADIYAESDRARDALEVLDMSIREGCEDPRAAWQAGLTAMQLERFDAALSYFDRFEALQPGECWTQHYRAFALLECERASEALDALEMESQRNQGAVRLNVEILRAWAMSQLKDLDAFRQLLDGIMAIPLVQVDFLTETGVMRLFEKLHAASDCLPPDDPQRATLRSLLLESGAAPNALFDEVRRQNEAVEGVNFCVCQVRQPLDERWRTWPGCLCGQEEWCEYFAHWGVLARDEDEAVGMVLSLQQECFPLPAEVLDCTLDSEGYTDAPGVVWQGLRRPSLDAEE